MIEREQSLFPNQLLKARPIRLLGHCLRHPQGDLISKYALYHPTHGKPRSGGRKILYHEYAAKLINPENSPFLTKIVLWHRTAKLGSTWRSAADTTGNPHNSASVEQREYDLIDTCCERCEKSGLLYNVTSRETCSAMDNRKTG